MTNVSPVKKGNYFDMRLVSKTDTRRAVCFVVDRRDKILRIPSTEIPCENNKFFSQ